MLITIALVIIIATIISCRIQILAGQGDVSPTHPDIRIVTTAKLAFDQNPSPLIQGFD